MDAEANLVVQARAGSEEAFVELLQQHQAHIRAYLTRYVRRSEVVQDLAQETFLRAYQSLNTYRAEAPLRVWLLSIARNCALVYLRDEGRRRTHEARSFTSAFLGWMAQAIEANEPELSRHERELEALQKCLQGLPETSAGLVKEHYFNGRSVPDIARSTGKTDTSLWMALSRIRQALRNCVGARLSTTGARS